MGKAGLPILFFMLSFSLQSLAQQVFPSARTGSYNLTLPPDDYAGVNTFDLIGNGATGYSYVTKGNNYRGPFQSHQWWTSALWNVNLGDGTDGEVTYRGDNHSKRMFPYPMILTAGSAGYEIQNVKNANSVSGANQVNNGPVLTHLRVGFIGQSSTTTIVDGYGDWHAKFVQTYGGDSLKATTASGSPYLFVERTGNTDMYLYSQGTTTLNARYIDANVEAITITADPQNNAATQGVMGIFFPPGTLVNGAAVSSLTVGNMLHSFNADIPNGRKYISVAVMPDATPATLALYAQKAFNFITASTHTYSYDEATATLNTNFNLTTTNVYGAANTGTLQVLYRHQWLYSPQATGATSTTLTYPSPRGTMKVVNTNSFQTNMPNLGILPNLGWANTANRTTLNTYITNYGNSLAAMPNAADGYNKDDLSELTSNIQIARQLGNTVAFNQMLTQLRNRLQDWLVSDENAGGGYNRYFGYSPLFNHMSHYPNGFGSSGTMVDAHFHIGYFVNAAAILARYDANFVTNYGPMVEVIIRSIANETKDMTDPGANGTVRPWFPYLKYFDPYAGHSWANAMADDQESVSEAIHFATGVFLWGETVQNTTMRDLGALLFITETEAARQYWFDVDNVVNGAPYANAYNHQHLTMLYNWGGNYATFFGTNPEYIHGITYLPVTGASTWLGAHVAGAAADYAQIGGSYATWGGWGQTINAQQAVSNPAGAIAAFNANNGGWAASKRAFTYHWNHTFDSVGVIDATVRANTSSFQVFTKGSCKHYMIYMPKGKGPRSVTFTDGQVFNVPDDTVIVYKVCPLPVDLLSFDAKNVDNVYAQLNWTTLNERNHACFDVQRSADGISWNAIARVYRPDADGIVKQYSHRDEHPFSGINYYRLKQIDHDGNFTYSQIRSVLFSNNHIAVYPNPVKDMLQLHASEAGVYELTLLDLIGKTLWTQELTLSAMEEKQVILSEISAGVYLLQVKPQGQGALFVQKIIKE